MKKLLAIVLVLGMASIVSAAPLQWSVDSLTLNVGETTTVRIIGGDTNVYKNFFAYSENLGIAKFTAASALAGAGSEASASILALEYGPSYEGYANLETLDSTDPFTCVPGEWFELTVMAVAEGTTVFHADAFGAYGDDTMAVNVVPEPITMTLLGLGGLGLLRRRR